MGQEEQQNEGTAGNTYTYIHTHTHTHTHTQTVNKPSNTKSEAVLAGQENWNTEHTSVLVERVAAISPMSPPIALVSMAIRLNEAM